PNPPARGRVARQGNRAASGGQGWESGFTSQPGPWRGPADDSQSSTRSAGTGPGRSPTPKVVRRHEANLIMVSTWFETAAKGRHGGPVRAGMWSACVVGTHPIEANQAVWLEISADDVALGPLPAFWVENKGVNSLWHVPIPPQAVGARLHYRSTARHEGSEPAYSGYQDTIVRPNLPERTESADVVPVGPEGLVGNRMMTVR